MRCRSNRTLALVTCWLALAAGLSAQESKSPVTGGQSSVSDAAETREQLETLLSETRAELAALPAEPPADSAEARRQTALERRLALATEFLALVASEETLKSELADAQGRVDQVREEHDALEGLAPPKPPPAPTKADYEAVNQALSASRGLVAGLRRAALERSARAEQAPTQGTEARERLTRATVVIQELSTQLGDAVTEAERGLLELRLENARLEADLARRKETHLSALVAAEKELEPVRAAAMVLEESRLARRESEFQAYGSAMEELLAKERQELDRQLTQSQQEAGQAVTPAERFLAKWRTAGLQFKQNAGALEGQLVGLDKEIGEQEKLLQAEQEELTGLKDFVLRSGVVGRAAERIKQTHQRIKVRTELLTRSLASRFEGLLSAQRARRLEIEEDQLGLAERFPSERQAVLDQLTPEVGAAFKSEASGLLEDYRSALRDEKSLVTDVITKGSRLQSLIQDRLLSLGALERFVRSKLFRIRDGEILGWGVVRGVGEELSSIVEWARSTFSQGSLGRLRESSQTPGNLAIALLLFPLLPIVLFVLRQRVRSFVRSRNQRTVDRGRNLANSSLAILGGLISATLLPFYLYLAGRFIGSAELHPNLDPVLSRTVIHIAFVLFAWFLARSFFSGSSIAQVQLRMDPEAVHALYRALRQVLISAVSLLLIFDVLRQPPLELVGLPRIAYTLFCVSVAIAIFRLLRPSSAFVTGALARPGSDRMRRVWPAINGIVTLIMLAVIVLDVAGYRYGSKQLAISVLQTLVLILLASPLHYWLISAVTTLTGRRKPAALAEAPGSEQPGELEVRDTAERLVGFVRVLSLIAVVLVLSRIWGVDQQALESLGETQLYEVGEDQHVSALNVLQLLAFVAGTIWLLRVLPGIFEFLIFSRITLDSGLRYAILTISQYALFTIGFLLALSAIRLDLSRLGWLLAAMGVGLGFGLQEIVSNFVSGIILLVERPIRVGDIVTITQVSGTVKRINIRATTLLNFDRQEVIIPNRKLITGDVTNWTGSDSINRLVIPIGVAYGSNVDRVSEILTGVIRGQPEVLVDPAPTVLFVAHGESSLNFELRVFVPDPSHKMPLLDRLNKAINKALAAERIEIPFPQRDVHIRSEQVTSDGRGPNGE